jgi:hypothetical protein
MTTIPRGKSLRQKMVPMCSHAGNHRLSRLARRYLAAQHGLQPFNPFRNSPASIADLAMSANPPRFDAMAASAVAGLQ